VRRSSSDGSWTLYVGGLYEEHEDGSYVNYYWALGRRIAMRTHQPGEERVVDMAVSLIYGFKP